LAQVSDRHGRKPVAVDEAVRREAGSHEPVDHGGGRQAAALAEIGGIFRHHRTGARKRAGGAFDHGRLIALHVDLQHQHAAIAEAKSLHGGIEIDLRDQA
jgi:hypothetical protein